MHVLDSLASVLRKDASIHSQDSTENEATVKKINISGVFKRKKSNQNNSASVTHSTELLTGEINPPLETREPEMNSPLTERSSDPKKTMVRVLSKPSIRTYDPNEFDNTKKQWQTMTPFVPLWEAEAKKAEEWKANFNQPKRADINAPYHATKLAKKLYEGLYKYGKTHHRPIGNETSSQGRISCDGDKGELRLEDFIPHFDTLEEAEKAFKIFDQDNNGGITRREMRDVISELYKERKALAGSLTDLSQAVGGLDQIFYGFTLLITFFGGLISFGISLVDTLYRYILESILNICCFFCIILH